MKLNLNDALNSLSVPELKLLHKCLNSAQKPTRKAEIITSITDKLLSDDLINLWNRLTELEKNVVRETLYNLYIQFNYQQFSAKYGRVPKSLTSYSKEKLLNLFIYQVSDRYESATTIPVELQARLRMFVNEPAQATLSTHDRLPETISNSETNEQPLICRTQEQVAQYELTAMLRMIENREISVSAKTRKPTTASVKKITEKLIGGDFFEQSPRMDSSEQKIGAIKAFAWPMLLQSAKFANMDGTKLKLTKAGNSALKQAPETVIQQIWDSWIWSSILDEFSRIEAVKGQRRSRGRRVLSSPDSRRYIVEDILEVCPIGEWISFDDLSIYIRATGLDFTVADNYWHLYVGDPRYGSFGYSGFDVWKIVEESYLLCLLFEYAATLGLIDVAYTLPHDARNVIPSFAEVENMYFLSRYDGLKYIRINPLGAYCLNLVDQYVPTKVDNQTSLRLMPNLRVEVVNGALTPEEKMLIENYAIAESDNSWCLDRTKCLEALENGRPPEELREFLSARDDQLMPEKMEGFLREIVSNAFALDRLETAVIYECADSQLATYIATNDMTKKYCRMSYQNTLVVHAASEKAFKDAVHKLGYGIQTK